MFKEFDSSTLEQWNSLTEEQRNKAINEGDVQVAVDIEIKVESHQRIVEEHKYYQVCSYGNYRLINNIIVLKATEKETFFSINNDSANNVSIKTNEEKEFEIGKSPYTTKYRIKVSNIKYGQALEL